MMKIVASPGSIIKIPLNQHISSYGVILNYGDIVFFNRFSKEFEGDGKDLLNDDVLLEGFVNESGVESGRWPIIGELSLPEYYSDSIYYIPDIFDANRFSIYHNRELLKYEKKYSRLAYAGVVWSPENIEQILLAYYKNNNLSDLPGSEFLSPKEI